MRRKRGGWYKQYRRHSLVAEKAWRTRRRNLIKRSLSRINRPITNKDLSKYDIRTPRAKSQDRKINADKILSRRKKDVLKWALNPNKYDIRGYDTRLLYKKAKLIKKKLAVLKKENKKIKQTEFKIKEQVKKRKEKYDTHRLTGVEREALYSIADKYGVSRDKIDWQSMIDSTLTPAENKTILSEYIKNIGEFRLPNLDIEKYEFQYREYEKELKQRAEMGDFDAKKAVKMLSEMPQEGEEESYREQEIPFGMDYMLEEGYDEPE